MEQFASLIKAHQERVERALRENLALLGPDTPLKQVCAYAVLNGGKRLRPVISLMLAQALGNKADVTQAALAVEYFHCASLVADDMPCMDDDDERRGKPATHKAFGEGLALLASYALIAEGYGSFAKCREQNPQLANRDEACALSLENAAFNTGIFGATGGQFSDLCPPTPLTEEAIADILHRKTGSLYEIAFVCGWLFGGGDVSALDKVKALAWSFGQAFQIADDFDDLEQDAKNERAVNLPARVGLERASLALQEHLSAYRLALQELGIDSEELLALADFVAETAAGAIDSRK